MEINNELCIMESEDFYKDIHYFILMCEDGHRCGYVDIDGIKYKDFDFDSLSVNGGITYVDNTSEYKYTIGFDCMHIGDAKDFENALLLFKDNDEVIKSLLNQQKLLHNIGTVRSLDFVKEELISLIDQLTQ